MRKHPLWLLVSVALIAVACGSPAATGTTNPTASAGATGTPAATATQAASATPGTTATATAGASATAGTSGTPAATATGALPSGVPTAIGEGEGSVTVLNWPGYVESGDNGVDWVTPFEEETGCQVESTPFGTSDAAFQLFTTNPDQFDVISASGDASLRLVRAGYVQPVNVDLIASYAEIYSSLKDQPYNTVDGVHYGVAHGRGSNLLMWRTDEIDPAPTAWSQMFKSDSGYKVSVYDAPIYIADAAVVLMHDKPELGITNPYALDDTQFQAAIDLLTAQRGTVAQYWSDYLLQQQAFSQADANIGTTWQVITNLLQAETPPAPVDAVKPVEGATGWSDTWMINSKAKHINCAYKFVNYITSAPVQIQIVEWYGEAPGNSKACDLETIEGFCEQFHAADNDPFWDDVHYWQTPEAVCVDGRTDVQCKDFDAWSTAWTALKG